jgi:hypothetical protein
LARPFRSRQGKLLSVDVPTVVGNTRVVKLFSALLGLERRIWPLRADEPHQARACTSGMRIATACGGDTRRLLIGANAAQRVSQVPRRTRRREASRATGGG